MKTITKTLLWITAILLLSGCIYLPGGFPTMPPTFEPVYSETATVRPLPSPTSWSTKTPRPTQTPTATPLTCWQDGGQLVDIQVPSQYLPDPLNALVYLPPCYDAQPERTYPTLYLIHGQSYTPQQWVRLGVVEIADAWIGDGSVGPFMMVMLEVTNWEEPAEYPLDLAVMEDLLPYMENNYRASPNRAYREVGGISRGASWAAHFGLKYWDSFSAFGGHSLPIFFEDAPQVPFWLDAIPADQYPRIYVDYAGSDQNGVTRSSNWFLGQLRERNIPYTFSTAPGVHDDEYWGGQLEKYMLFYLSEW